jgi:hypothetical protein
LPEAKITSFEARHGFELLAAYRRFLLEVGNGGDGPPTCGLMPLGSVPSDLYPSMIHDWKRLPNVTKPFPLTEAWWSESEPFDADRDAASRHGSLNLGTDGCGLYWLLIVTGAERSHMWARTDVGFTPTEPRWDFLQWVEAWLDGSEWWD